MKKIEDLKNTIICCDVLDGLRQIPSASVHLCVTSPPYNVNLKGYKARNDNQPYAQYVDWLHEIFSELHRILVDGGRLVINIDAMTNRQEDAQHEYVRPIYADLVEIGRKTQFSFRTEICWYKQNAVGRKTAWGSYMSCSNPIIRRNHEYILVWSKGDYKLEGDSELSDMTKKEFEEWTFSTWHIQPETRNLNDHPAPYPEELARRIIKLFSYRDNLILDPFMGTGTTGVVCKKHARNYIGIDNSPTDVEYATARIENIGDIFTEYVTRSTRINEQKKKNIDSQATNIL